MVFAVPTTDIRENPKRKEEEIMFQETEFTEEAAEQIVQQWSEATRGRRCKCVWKSGIRKNNGNPFRIVTFKELTDSDGVPAKPLMVFVSGEVVEGTESEMLAEFKPRS